MVRFVYNLKNQNDGSKAWESNYENNPNRIKYGNETSNTLTLDWSFIMLHIPLTGFKFCDTHSTIS